ncbi:unnamed protein product [Ilex paraguariensis]|uniref:Uncharacterized protein n=1 Tax=Ilex paraguariensis TaxID=185542 RepID=A0ABC8URV9_9AQUA
MSDKNSEDAKELDLVDSTPKDQEHVDPSVEDLKLLDENVESPMPSPQEEEEVIKKKYGGLIPKKPPLISKVDMHSSLLPLVVLMVAIEDHERAFFDSADWALGKGAQKSKGPLEALRPKLQPTPHQQVRRSAYAPAGEGEDGDNNDATASEDESFPLEVSNNNNSHTGNQNSSN